MRRGAVLSILLFAACAHTRQPSSDFQPGDAENAIRAANAAFVDAARTGNVDRIVNDFYAADAQVMAPGFPTFRGRESIRQVMSGLIGRGVDLVLTTEDVMQSDDLAVERGTYEIRGANRDSGKYVVVWRKIDDHWRAVTDIMNGNGATR